MTAPICIDARDEARFWAKVDQSGGPDAWLSGRLGKHPILEGRTMADRLSDELRRAVATGLVSGDGTVVALVETAADEIDRLRQIEEAAGMLVTYDWDRCQRVAVPGALDAIEMLRAALPSDGPGGER